MAKYIFQLRRGQKITDADGNTIRDDWAEYEAKENHIKPLEGELVLEYDNGIPRLKIGDGINEFSALPYMSVDSFILPTPASITIYPDKWEQTRDDDGNLIENRYYQYVTVDNAVITPNSKIDLQPKPEDLVIFHEKDITFTAVNSGGNVRVCVIGQMPTQEYTMQVTVTEVAENA
jgi:hypothetical protein